LKTIIDRKGRLFGKINVIDFLVVVFLFCFIPMFYYGYKIFTKRSAIPTKEIQLEERIIDLYVILKEIDEDMVKLISVGDKDINELGQIEAEILRLGKIENNSLDINLGNNVSVTGQDSRKKQISTKMRMRCQIEDGKYLYFKGKKITRSTLFEFKTDKYKVKGIIAKMFEIAPLVPFVKEKWITLRVEISGVLPEIAKVIKEGDVEKNAFDEVVARIQSIINNKPSQLLSVREDDVVVLNHPFNRDMLLSLNVLCAEREGVYYFKNYPVKMGNNIVLAMELYSISGVIVGMQVK
jgi:hypothetical protein